MALVARLRVEKPGDMAATDDRLAGFATQFPNKRLRTTELFVAMT